MKRSIKKLGIVAALLLPTLLSEGQNVNPLNLTNIIPPSPEVSELGKYVNIPVGYTTGVPQISIPFYILKAGSLEVPVTLSYHASGLRVEETASWVGLGWSLNTGGVISRVVHGLPDDFSSNGYMYAYNTVPKILALPNDDLQRHAILYDTACVANGLDVEPDEYIFSAMGYSGKFYFDQNRREFVQAPYSRVKIYFTTDIASAINGFKLVLPNGNQCFFGLSHDSTRSAYDIFNGQTTISYTQTSGYALSPNPGGLPTHITSWQLMDIIAPTSKIISYYYSSYNAIDYGRAGESIDYRGSGGCSDAQQKVSISFFQQKMIKSRLIKISSDICDVYFKNNGQNRQDVIGNQASLDTVVIQNKNGLVLKKISLHFSYFTSTDLSGINIGPFYPPNTSVLTVSPKRLRLDSVQELSSINEFIPPYRFFYNPLNLPDKLSANQDYWGYYNGKSNGFFLTPTVAAAAINGTPGVIPGADRTIDTNNVQACLLQKIQYPTGGTTEYFFEPNRALLGNFGISLLNGYQYSGLANKVYLFYNSPYMLVSQNLSAAVYVDSFSIGLTQDQIHIRTTGCTDFNNLSCPLSIQITGITDPSFLATGITAADFYKTLPQGKYKIKATVQITDEGTIPQFNVGLTWSEFSTNNSPNNTLVGGVRLKKVMSKDPLNNITLTKSFIYQLRSDSTGNTSSGNIANLPVHAYSIPCGTQGMAGQTMTNGVSGLTNTVTRISSNSALPLSSADGNIIRYTNITEFQDERNSSNKTEFTYSNDLYDIINPNGTNYPYPIDTKRDWRNDLLLRKKQYSLEGKNNYRLLDDQQFYYVESKTYINDSFGIIIAPLISQVVPSFSYASYSFITEWYVLDSSVHISYPSGGSGIPMISYSKYFYDQDNFNVINERTKNSKGEFIDQKKSYPTNYNNVSGSHIGDLIQANMIEKPIRQEVSKNGKLIKGVVTIYNEMGLPDSIFQYENSLLIDTSAINPNLIVPVNYVLKDVVWYNTSGNTSQAYVPPGKKTAFIWDYINNYPVCKADNADTSSIAYTSFEADGKGYWNFSGALVTEADCPTGNNCFDLGSSNIVRSNLLIADTFIVSYWSKSGAPCTVTGSSSYTQGKTINNWTYFEHVVSGVTDVIVSGNGKIDELRLYPATAQMTTFTYFPLVGITTNCDVSNKITYYDYDDFKRLKAIKDQYSNILKTYEYHYWGIGPQ